MTRFCDLPTLVFKTKAGRDMTLSAPPPGVLPTCFWVVVSFEGYAFNDGYPVKLNPRTPAYAFFASQISLTDYHAGK